MHVDIITLSSHVGRVWQAGSFQLVLSSAMITYAWQRARVYVYSFEGFHRWRIALSLVNSPLAPKGIASATSTTSWNVGISVEMRDTVCLSRARTPFVLALYNTLKRITGVCGSPVPKLILLNRATARKSELWNNHQRCHYHRWLAV